MSAISKLLGQHRRPKQAPEPAAEATTGPQALLWCDRNGRRLRRRFISLLRRQCVTITRMVPEEPTAVLSTQSHHWTRAERAHRRQDWADRLARNASHADTPHYSFTLFGIVPALAAYLGLPSSAAA